MVGAYTTGSTSHGFRSDMAGNFTTIDLPGATSTQLFTINNNGVATGVGTSSNTTTWFTVDSAGNFKTITVPPPYTLSAAYGISDTGAISVLVSSSATSFAILNPDGTVTLVPGYNSPAMSQNTPGSINSSNHMLESDHSFGQTSLVNAQGQAQPIVFPTGGENHTFAFGLNNLGTIVGFENGGLGIPEFATGFTLDSAGVLSQALCPGSHNFFPVPVWQGINDNGIIVGKTYILTPLPGQPQLTFSSTSLSFPPTPVGQSSPPQYVTVTNTGNARLDIAATFGSASDFRFSGCLAPETLTASLDPGANCLLTVTAVPSGTGTRTGTFGYIDSAPLPFAQIAATVTGTAAPPSCVLSSISHGPPAQATFTMQDTNSGLKSIVLVDSSNAQVNIPTFVQGSTVPITVTATQSDTTQPSRADFQVTNVAGGAATCGTGFGGPEQWTRLGGSFSGKVAIFSVTDLPEAFVRGNDGSLMHIAQTAEGGGWTAWESLGGYLLSDPVIANPQTPPSVSAEVFVVGGDHALWHIKSLGGGTWSGWDSLGGSVTGDPAVAVNADGRLEVFVAGLDHSLWHIAQTDLGGPWGSWDPLGGVLASDPAVITNIAASTRGTLEVFVVGSDQRLWHRHQTSPGGSWSGWESLGGSFAGDVAPFWNSQDGRVEVLARGTDSALWDVAQTTAGGTWGSPISLGGVLTSDPSVALNSNPARAEGFVRGADNALWHIAQTSAGGSWGGWATLDGILANGPTAVRVDHGTLDAFVEGSDGALYYVSQISPGVWN